MLQLFYKTLHDTYTSTELIPEVFTNLFGRIKKFLSNFIFEHGEELGLYSQIRGQQMKWCVGNIEQWANRTGLREQYDTPSSCLLSILRLLSTPGEELVKVCCLFVACCLLFCCFVVLLFCCFVVLLFCCFVVLLFCCFVVLLFCCLLFVGCCLLFCCLLVVVLLFCCFVVCCVLL